MICKRSRGWACILLALGSTEFFRWIQEGSEALFFTAVHHVYQRKPRNKGNIPHSNIYFKENLSFQFVVGISLSMKKSRELRKLISMNNHRLRNLVELNLELQYNVQETQAPLDTESLTKVISTQWSIVSTQDILF